MQIDDPHATDQATPDTGVVPNQSDKTAHDEVTRKLRWYFISGALDFVGMAICMSILPYLAQDLGADGFGVGLIFTAFSIGMTISGAIFGKMADAHGRRCAVIVSTLATVVSYVLCAMANTYWLLFTARVISGLAAGSMAVTNSVIIDLVPNPQHRSKYTAMLGASQGVAFFLGPALAALFAPLGFHTIFFITAGFSSLGLLGVYLFAPETKPEDTPNTGKNATTTTKSTASSSPPQTSNATPRWSPLVFLPLVSIFLSSNSFAIMNSTHALLMQHNFGWGVTETGLLMASVGLVQIFNQALAVPRVVKAVGPTATIVISCGFMTLGMATYPFVGSWQLSVVFFYLYMLLGFSFVLPVVPLVVAELVPKQDTGKAMGMVLSCFALGRITGPTMGGSLWDMSHAYAFWFGCGTTTAATLLMVVLRVRQCRLARCATSDKQSASDSAVRVHTDDVDGVVTESDAADGDTANELEELSSPV